MAVLVLTSKSLTKVGYMTDIKISMLLAMLIAIGAAGFLLIVVLLISCLFQNFN